MPVGEGAHLIKLFYLSAGVERKKRFLGLPKPVQMDWTPGRVEAASVLVLILIACLRFSPIKHKASRYTARGYLIRQNNIIDLKIEASQCCVIKAFPLLFPSLFALAFSIPPPSHPPQRRLFKTIKTCFWNVIKLLEVHLHSRPLRRGPKEEEEKREVVEPAWPVWKVKRRFAPWASWETPSLTVSGREATLSYLIYSVTSCR